MGFRIKRGLRLTEAQQAYIWALSRLYTGLPPEWQREIRKQCKKSAGDYAQALLEFVTTDKTATEICMRHYMGRSTLYRCVKRYYENFPMP